MEDSTGSSKIPEVETEHVLCSKFIDSFPQKFPYLLSILRSTGIYSTSWLPNSILNNPALRNSRRSDSRTPEGRSTKDYQELEYWRFLSDITNYIPVGILRLRGVVDNDLPYAWDQNRWWLGSPCAEDSPFWVEFDSLNIVYLGEIFEKITPFDDSPRAYISLFNDLKVLLRRGWVRLFYLRHPTREGLASLRIYVLPADRGRTYPHYRISESTLCKALRRVLWDMDVSPNSWLGNYSEQSLSKKFSPSPPPNSQESLFYIFNTLPSPSPDPDLVLDPFSKEAMLNCLKGRLSDHGLRTKMYPYQRRSAAMMLQKEILPSKTPDPRLDTHITPTGDVYYFNLESTRINKDMPEYENVRGGILAETMGYGKTLITLALILATKGHFPAVPPQYCTHLIRSSMNTASLVDLAASTAARTNLPWKPFFDKLERQGYHHLSCRDKLWSRANAYETTSLCGNPTERSSLRNYQVQTIRMAPTTIIAVPDNLVAQWLTEIEIHTTGLEVLVIQEKDLVPPADDLIHHDVLLFSISRFQKELSHVFMPPVCLYKSPLLELHFLRLIVDEGHNFASSTGCAGASLMKKIKVERRWIVSGTPSNRMIGAEINLASYETSLHLKAPLNVSETIESHRTETLHEQEIADLRKIRSIVLHFFELKPWSNPKEHIVWTKYVYPSDIKDTCRNSTCLRQILSNLVVRHQWPVMEQSLTLPRLHNTVKYLEPTFYDKLSQNLFILMLTVNAVTSERKDQDYMFHPGNRRSLNALILNLRQSGFWWCGFRPDDIVDCLEVGLSYLCKTDKSMSPQDKKLLETALSIGEKALSSPGWEAFSFLNEMGLIVDNFPTWAQAVWELPGSIKDVSILAISHVRAAQLFVNSQLDLPDPFNGVCEYGVKLMCKTWESAAWRDTLVALPISRPSHPQFKGISRNATSGHSGSTNSEVTTHVSSSISDTSSVAPRTTAMGSTVDEIPAPHQRSTGASWFRRISMDHENPPQSTHQVSAPKIIGTVSAKLSYLLDRLYSISNSPDPENVLIFYSYEHVAYFLAGALEVFSFKFFIYNNSVAPSVRADYLSKFNDPSSPYRILLMDVKRASHGLHVASASRIFFIDPIWQASVEAQAIKRAHRIGQTREVWVETLVLKDTIEEKILRRQKSMTEMEMDKSKLDGLLANQEVKRIIQEQQFMDITEEDQRMPFARLTVPKQMFGKCDEKKDSSASTTCQSSKRKRHVDSCDEPSETERETTDAPPSKKKAAAPPRTDLIGSH